VVYPYSFHFILYSTLFTTIVERPKDFHGRLVCVPRSSGLFPNPAILARSRESSAGMGRKTGLYSRQGLEIFLFSTAFRLPLGPTQPPIEWVLWAIPLVVTRPGFEADYSPPSSAEAKNGGAIPLLPHTSSWRGA
jgi:hypothetical protein